MTADKTSNHMLRLVLIVLAVIVLAPLLMMAFAFPMMGMWGGMMGGFGGSGFSPLWGIGMMVVWLVVLVGGGYLVFRSLTGDGGLGTDPAMEELRLAYARGDLTEDEYEERRSKLDRE